MNKKSALLMLWATISFATIPVAYGQATETISTSTVTTTNNTTTNNTNNNTSNNTNTNTNTNYNIQSGTLTNINQNTSTSTNTSIMSGEVTYNNNNTNVSTNNNINTTTSNNTNNNINTSTSISTSNNVNTNNNTSNNTNYNYDNSVSSTDNRNLNINESKSESVVNTNNVNLNDNRNYNENVSKIEQEIKSPPPSAIAPMISAYSQDVCVSGVSGAVQTQVFGLSAGKAVRDMNCERLKLSKTLYDMGMKVAAVSLMCQDDRVFKAMEMAGTPCPYMGKIGSEATLAWNDNEGDRPDSKKKNIFTRLFSWGKIETTEEMVNE